MRTGPLSLFRDIPKQSYPDGVADEFKKLLDRRI